MFKGATLKALRLQHGFALQHVGDHIGSSKSYVWELESGGKNPSSNKLYQIAKLFDVKMEYFFHDPTPITDLEILSNRITLLLYDYANPPPKKENSCLT